MYYIELVWNREFNFVPYGKPVENLDEAIRLAHGLEDMGDGERVKKTRVVNDDGIVAWEYGRKTGKA